MKAANIGTSSQVRQRKNRKGTLKGGKINCPFGQFVLPLTETISPRVEVKGLSLSNRTKKRGKSGSTLILPSKAKVHSKAASHQLMKHGKSLKTPLKKKKKVFGSKYIGKKKPNFAKEDAMSTEGDDKEYNVDLIEDHEFLKELTKKSLSTIKGDTAVNQADISSLRGTPIMREDSKDRLETQICDLADSSSDRTEIDEMNLTCDKSRLVIF